MREDAESFVLNCGRINAVILMSQEYIQHTPHPTRGTTGTLSFGFVALGNPDPRNPADSLAAFFNQTVPTLALPAIDRPADSYRQDNELFDWLDTFWHGAIVEGGSGPRGNT
jgi:hypothetical protein